MLDYSFPFRPAWSQRSHIFLCRRAEGEVAESSELAAARVPVEEVPFERMWDDARFWLSHVLRGGPPVHLSFEFGADLEHVAAWGPPLGPTRAFPLGFRSAGAPPMASLDTTKGKE